MAASIYRMTEEAISRSEAKGTLTYGLDPVGNRQSLASTVTGMNSQTASYNPNDRVTGNTYDANGNTLGANGKSYAYDSMDRMTSFNNGSVKMVYDGDGNRVAKTVGGVTTQYLVDELNPTGLPQVMDEVVKSGAAQRTYLYGLRRISQTQVASGTTSYYGYDAHGDVRYLMNSSGVATDTYDYDAFGNIVGSTGTTPNVYRYQGEALDAETGLYYLRARYYDPTVGGFLNVDQMTDEGEHPYEYTDADPVNGHDPTGEQDVIEYSLLMWLYTAHVPPPHGYMSCQGGILFSGAGSGGGSGMQAADASAATTMSRLGVACQVGGGQKPASPWNPAQPKPGPKIGIGVEVPSAAAVQDGVLDVHVDPGHTFVYFRDTPGTVVSILSFGPPIGGISRSNKDPFLNGQLPGNAHWPLSGALSTWERDITSAQLAQGEQAIANFKAHVPHYTPTFQCTSAALSIGTGI